MVNEILKNAKNVRMKFRFIKLINEAENKTKKKK